MNSGLKNTVDAAGLAAAYDDKAKHLLSQKDILANILVNTVDEFKGMEARAVKDYIEGEPQVGSVPIEPGSTNSVDVKGDGSRITGMNTEDSEINEGMVRYDVIFYVRTRDGLSKIIINVEAQKRSKGRDLKYLILNRAVFYGCRMISSQRGRDFDGNNYDDIKKIYSIWICMDMDECSLNHVHLVNDTLLGNQEWEGGIDVFNVVMVGLPKTLPEHRKEYSLHRLLKVLFSDEMSTEDRLEIFSDEYGINISADFKKEMDDMCNLSQGILERGMERGMEKGIEKGAEEKLVTFVLRMHDKNYSVDQIVDVTNESVERIKEIIEEYKS